MTFDCTCEGVQTGDPMVRLGAEEWAAAEPSMAAEGFAHVTVGCSYEDKGIRAHSDEAQGGGVGGGGALDAVHNEEAAGGTGQRARIDQVIQQLAGCAHRLE